MPVLHLGVIDIPYATHVAEPQRRVAVRFKKGQKPRGFTAPPAGGETTGDVASYLEDKYHIMEHFFELHQDEIAEDVAKAVVGQLESLLMGAPASTDPFAEFTASLQTRFKKMLDAQELDKLGFPGIPTGAALRGVSHRFKHPYAKRDPRASFIDTGTYQSAFIAWVDG